VLYPALLAEMAAPRLRAYARETAIAEKVEAIVALGLANSRMKDFFDVWFLGRTFAFDEATLSTGIRATSERRRIPLPMETPLGLTAEFATNVSKAAQWRGFVARGRFFQEPPDLPDVVAFIATFIVPLLVGSRFGTPSANRYWLPGGDWQSTRGVVDLSRK